MTITYSNGTFEIVNHPEYSYVASNGQNGHKFVTLDSVQKNVINVSGGNTKTGEKCITYNQSIEYTCDHNCECYKEKKCYAETGCYNYLNNQRMYTENVAFFKYQTIDVFIDAIQLAIDTFKYKYFRWFTCGDITNTIFFSCMVKIAENNPDIKFWAYTKKYNIVNRWIEKNGSLPENLTIIFSHWLNNDGTYFPMENPYNLPTSEFIPFGKEELAKTVDFICPCSDPTIKATCLTCDHPCFNLKHGQKQALLEHSTAQTKERDKAIKSAKNKL